jgi:hypothetical protein
VRRHAARPTDFGWEGKADFHVWFHFVPTADEKITAGFPLFVIDREKNIHGAPVQDFKVLAGGRELTTETRFATYGGMETRWATFPLEFRKGTPLDLEVAYSLPVHPYGKTVNSDLWIAYVLRTGAYWAGTIGKAEATLTMDRPIRPEDLRTDGVRGTTPGWELRDGALHWEWQEIEPDFDLSVQIANVYWLDTPQEIRALLDGGLSDRDALLRVLQGTRALFEGDARSGYWMQVRGESSEKAGERLLPEVLALLRDHIGKNPQDWEVRQQYLRLLFASAWHLTWDGWSLYNEERFRDWLAEARRYRKDGGPDAPGDSYLPWTGTPGNVQLSEATQREVAAFLLDLMPASFSSEAAARQWVASRSGPALAAEQTQPLVEEALRRVPPPAPLTEAPQPQPSPAPATEAPQPQPSLAPLLEPAAQPEPQPPKGIPGWGMLLTGGLAILAGGGLLWRWRFRPWLPRNR